MIYLKTILTTHAFEWLSLVNTNRQELEYWLPYLKDIQTLDETRQYIETCKQLDFYSGNCVYGVWLNQSLIGEVVLQNGKRNNKSVELGYWLGIAYRGHSWIYQACSQLINKVFIEYNIDKITIKCLKENVASRRVATKLKFELFQTTETTCEYQLLREEWWFEYEIKDYLSHFFI